ncbi:MAG: NAD(P)H-binding protein [Bacteroidaceae bacterium]
MNIAVTQASGQLGGTIIAHLIKKVGQDHVIGLARTPNKAVHLGCEIRKGDYDDAAQMELSLNGVDALLLISGNAHPDLRIPQHRKVIAAAQKSGVTKLVYVSIEGPLTDTYFSPIVQSNRTTEEDVKASGLKWAIGRNGIYIEPDVDYIESYKAMGCVKNCAGEGLCGYTTRQELAEAYVQLLVDDTFEGGTFNLHGPAISQLQLVHYLNDTFQANLTYQYLSVKEYKIDRTAELGDLYGGIISGIYDGISRGAFNEKSDFEKIVGRPHITWDAYFHSLK